MEIIEIHTLVDITRPRVWRPGQGSELEQKQFKNWTTFLQCIELRSIIASDEPLITTVSSLKGMGFGSKYTGEHTYWTYRFVPDRDFSYQDETGNLIGFLLNDLHNVPVIPELMETIRLQKCVFDTQSSRNKNCVITITQTDTPR